jgi:alanine racemase
MYTSRRSFLGAALSAGLVPRSALAAAACDASAFAENRFDPWVEVEASHLRFNVQQVSRLTKGRPILAVLKNNAYGLALIQTARILEPLAEIVGFAVVKAGAALALRNAGIKKPVLLMGMCSLKEGHELVARDVELSLYTDDASERVASLAKRAGKAVRAHFYLDTGLGRLGMPYHRALPWLEKLAARPDLDVTGTFMAFTEEPDFDPEQLARFLNVAEQARAKGLNLGRLHAASSNAVFHLPSAHLDLVRPGIALFGAYPSRPDEEKAKAELRPAVRLRTRVVRVEQLRPGDTVGYGRKYVAAKPTWTATLPAGHVDGVPRKAVEGARVLIQGRTYPTVGAVSASHCIVELGDAPAAKVGDVATLVGPDHPAIHPNALAEATGVSVYDILMHLDPGLPRYVV